MGVPTSGIDVKTGTSARKDASISTKNSSHACSLRYAQYPSSHAAWGRISAHPRHPHFARLSQLGPDLL